MLVCGGTNLLCLLAIFLMEVHTSLVVLGGIALFLMTATVLAGMFGPMPSYEITHPEELPPNQSEGFLCLLESLADAKINRRGTFEVFTNGKNFYPAELEAIRNATRSVNLEAYIYQKSKIGGMYLEAMTERARAEVEANWDMPVLTEKLERSYRDVLRGKRRITCQPDPA